MSTSPNMLLSLPDVSVTLGPQWAALLNACLLLIDDHDHTSGKGKQVPIAGVDINQDLNLSNFQLTETKAVQFMSLLTALSGALNANKFQVVAGDVWFTNGGGVPVQITSGNSIVSNVVIPGSPLMPSGALLDFAGSVAPVGFLLCDGAAVSRTTYSDLFAAVGTVYGPGNGTTTFNIPNFNGRTSVGTGTYTDTVSGSITRSIGQVIGAEKHVLTTAQMPSHTHIQDAHSHTITTPVGGGGAGSGGTVAFPTGQTGFTVATNQYTGGDLSHNNMQPSLVILKMIKT